MRIFLVAGSAGSGKGEVAKIIKEYYIYKLQNCVITEYSKYLKYLAQELTDWDGNPNTKPRKYLQELGDTARGIDSKFLIKRMLDDIKLYQTMVDNVIIADVRLPEEIDDIRECYDKVYAIYIENQFSQSNLTVEEQSHITETSLENYDEFDYIIANDDKNTLKDKVFKYLEGLE